MSALGQGHCLTDPWARGTMKKSHFLLLKWCSPSAVVGNSVGLEVGHRFIFIKQLMWSLSVTCSVTSLVCTNVPFSLSCSPFLRSVSQVKRHRLWGPPAWWALVPAVKFWNKASDHLKIPLLPSSPPRDAVAANSHLGEKEKDPAHSWVINLPFLTRICLSVFRFTCHLVLNQVWIGVLVCLGKGNFTQVC